MTREQALELLAATSPHERLKGARFLARNSEAADLALLRGRRSSEPVSYVRAGLDKAISRARRQGAEATSTLGPEQEVPDDVRRELRSEAMRWIAGLLLHEMSGPIGLVDNAASQEIANYESSLTRRRLETVQRIFGAIEHLQTAASPAKFERFDLPTFIEEVLFEELGDRRLEVSVHGPKPLQVAADPRLLRLAFCNGLRNAREAVAGMTLSEGDAPVVVTWDVTDVDVWISIIDSGPGLTSSVERAFEAGKSTKQDHIGFGLAIARQAMESLGGTVQLPRSTSGGVRYELLWER